MLDSIGLTIPPCGLPLSDGWYVHSSQYPAFRAPSINRRKRLSWMFSRRLVIRMWWLLFSNKPLMFLWLNILFPTIVFWIPLEPFGFPLVVLMHFFFFQNF